MTDCHPGDEQREDSRIDEREQVFWQTNQNEKYNMIQHVALIMDGNRRWAKEKGLPTLVGHAKGYKRIERIVNHADTLGIKYITFWAFSTENWNRCAEEVSYLMDLFRKLFKGTMLKKMLQKNGKVTVLGDITAFPLDIQKKINNVIEKSKNNTGIQINIALNYGGRSEIVHAVSQIVARGISAEEITEEVIARNLYTALQPDPELIIRTGGEQRLSGYLPWQSVYSELYFTQEYWPDFDEASLDRAISEYEHRERRFGK